MLALVVLGLAVLGLAVFTLPIGGAARSTFGESSLSRGGGLVASASPSHNF